MLGIVEQQRCIRLHGALHLRLLLQQKKKMLREVTVLVGLWCACSAVLHAKRVCVCEDEYARDRCVYRSVYVFVYSGTSISRASRYIEVPLYYTLEMAFPAG